MNSDLKPDGTADITADVAIVGGGLAGGLASLALSDAGFTCALIDASDPQSMREAKFDGRTTAISYACARVFRRLGLWPSLAPHAEPIRDILVTDGKARSALQGGTLSSFALHFDSAELSGTSDEETPLGWVIENRILRNVLFDAIATQEKITLLAPAMRKSTTLDGATAQLQLSTGQNIRAALVVAADGRMSTLRSETKIKTNRWRYKQCGIVTTLAHERDHDGIAQEFFLPSGPFAILPMTQDPTAELKHRSSIVWTETAASADAYLALSEDDFLTELSNRVGPYLGALACVGPRWSHPLSFHLSHRFVAPRLALIGDAARAIHPIAGQGFNLGVKDIAALVDTLTQARDVGLDIGSLNVLEKYQSWRRFDSAALAFSTDILNRLFSNDIAPIRALRTIGMGATNKVAPLRRFFMRQAGADIGELPSLMSRD